jgi:hypothetical protein
MNRYDIQSDNADDAFFEGRRVGRREMFRELIAYADNDHYIIYCPQENDDGTYTMRELKPLVDWLRTCADPVDQ